MGGQDPPGDIQDHGASPVGSLTDTECRIAGLVAQGKTNREVASAMFVTENTVQTHVRHIFQKLGVRSRTELTALFLSASANNTRTVLGSPGGPASR